MQDKILSIIEKNSKIDTKELAVLVGEDEEAVKKNISDLEQKHVICGYPTLIDWDKAGIEKVTALIEVRVTPQRGMGFDRVARRIYNYPEVSSVYLISGGLFKEDRLTNYFDKIAELISFLRSFQRLIRCFRRRPILSLRSTRTTAL